MTLYLNKIYKPVEMAVEIDSNLKSQVQMQWRHILQFV
jgi:hypothetical protein